MVQNAGYGLKNGQKTKGVRLQIAANSLHKNLNLR